MTNHLRAPVGAPSSAHVVTGVAVRRAVGLFLVTSLVACSPAAAPSATPPSSGGPATQSRNPGASPTTGPTLAANGGLEHPTGAHDIVLRFEETGGFVPIEANATYTPSFTLYGDGTVVFRDPTAVPPEVVNNVQRPVPLMVARLGEDAIQALLSEALGRGGLAIAQGPYMGMGADIPTSTFTIAAGGKTKQVSVTALSPEMHEQDKVIVGQLAAFAERLWKFGDSVGTEEHYVPASYRGILMKVDQPFGPVIAWPWKDLTPADFNGGENDVFLTRTMSPAEVDALGIPSINGGMTGVALQSEGSIYTLSLRPLLPEEAR
jgi:hypothetical protein